MKNLAGKTQSYLALLGHLFLGLFILIGIQTTRLSSGFKSIIILVLFILINIIYRRILNLQSEFTQFWSPKKIVYLFIAILGGVLIAVLPLILTIIMGRAYFSGFNIKEITFTSFILTFLISSWEELWFRSLILNYCSRFLSAINISLTVGVLFTLMHVLNPEISLLQKGPALFFAGALLTLLYFYYQTIWVPVGLHFGNNYCSELFNNGHNDDIILGNDAYFSAILLAGIFFVYMVKFKRKFKDVNIQERYKECNN